MAKLLGPLLIVFEPIRSPELFILHSTVGSYLCSAACVGRSERRPGVESIYVARGFFCVLG